MRSNYVDYIEPSMDTSYEGYESLMRVGETRNHFHNWALNKVGGVFNSDFVLVFTKPPFSYDM